MILREIIYNQRQLHWVVNKFAGQPFAFDIETTGLNNRFDQIVGLALTFESGDSFYIPFFHTVIEDDEQKQKVFFTLEEVRRFLAPLFAQDVLMVAHNSKFELGFFRRNNVKIQGRVTDTLLMAQLDNENRQNDLKSLAASILGMEYAKYQTLGEYAGFGKHDILGVPLEKAADYAMNDTEATYKLYQHFAPVLAANSFRGKTLLDVHNDLWMPLTSVLEKMESRGIAMDMEGVIEFKEEQIEIAKHHEERVTQAGLKMVASRDPSSLPAYYLKIATDDDLIDAYENTDGNLVVDRGELQLPIVTHEMVGKTKTFKPRIPVFNTGSPKQLSELVFDYSNVTIPERIPLKRTKEGLYSADHDNLETLLFYSDGNTPDYLEDVLAWRKAEKTITTYLNRFIADCDPNDHYALHGQFHIAASESGRGGTATGRLSSSNPNMQNMTARGELGKRMRSLFVARPEHKLLVADLAQAELRVLAHYSKDKALLQAFAQEQDLHVLTGAGCAQVAYDELLERYEAGDPWAKQMRQVGKTANFALQYGMGPPKFQRYLLINNKYEISVEEARRIIDAYNETYAGATKWKADVAYFIAQNGYVRTISGRMRRLIEAFSPDKWKRMRAERQGVNAIIQGSVGDLMGMAMIRIQPELEKLGGSLLLQVHDELVSEVPMWYAEQAKLIIEKLMIEDANMLITCPMKSDCGIGDNWHEAKG